MSPLISCMLSNVGTRRAIIQEQKKVLNLNREFKANIENNSKYRGEDRISPERIESDNLNLAISEVEFITILEPSECGKSILFNMLANIDTSNDDSKLIEGLLIDSITKQIIKGTRDMSLSSTPSQSHSKTIDAVPTSRFRCEISSTDQSR
jgi:ABC-type nitrate/sulfonate/bicarbonate transport system ATPase subunit